MQQHDVTYERPTFIISGSSQHAIRGEELQAVEASARAAGVWPDAAVALTDAYLTPDDGQDDQRHAFAVLCIRMQGEGEDAILSSPPPARLLDFLYDVLTGPRGPDAAADGEWQCTEAQAIAPPMKPARRTPH